ncbi:MAG: hypothetical protein KGI08_10000 [Thaumarchaeota archaeon]|nr:hypothetical protein [Nitrososphaerota archaeon]
MTNIVTNLPPETMQDIAKVLTDFGFHITASGIVQTVAAIFILARLLRKAVPDNWQNGPIGTVLKHSALEVNPDQPKVTITQTTTNGTRPIA